MGEVVHVLPRAAREILTTDVEPRPAAAVRTHTIYVVQTSIEDTLAAVPVAAELAGTLKVPVTVVQFRTPPRLAAPDALAGVAPSAIDPFIERVRADGLDVRVRIYVCRNERHAFPLAFDRHSLIVIGGRGRWWPARVERWRRTLERAGHIVMFVDTSSNRRETSHA
jgi:hypothetical protein